LGPNFYVFLQTETAKAAIMPKPSGEWLAEDLLSLKSSGFDVIVSLLEPSEATELGLGQEAIECHKSGLQFVGFPIVDRGLPNSPQKFVSLADDLSERIHAGQSIAIHCRAGIGRSGMVAAALLMIDGSTAVDAISAVSLARKVTTPDTPEQIEFLQQQTRLSR